MGGGEGMGANLPREKRGGRMKCSSCGYEGSKGEFRYLYNTRLDEPWTFRECPKCYAQVVCEDELAEEKKEGISKR
jgi:hypothetical protein